MSVGSQVLIRNVGGLWACDVGGVWQWHASWREAAESLAVIRRFRKRALGLAKPLPSLPRQRVTVTKHCTSGPCKETQDPESLWGMCPTYDEVAEENLSMHRGRKNPR